MAIKVALTLSCYTHKWILNPTHWTGRASSSITFQFLCFISVAHHSRQARASNVWVEPLRALMALEWCKVAKIMFCTKLPFSQLCSHILCIAFMCVCVCVCCDKEKRVGNRVCQLLYILSLVRVSMICTDRWLTLWSGKSKWLLICLSMISDRFLRLAVVLLVRRIVSYILYKLYFLNYT